MWSWLPKVGARDVCRWDLGSFRYRGRLHAGIRGHLGAVESARWDSGHLGAVESARWDSGSFTQWTSARCDFVSHLKLITWLLFFFIEVHTDCWFVSGFLSKHLSRGRGAALHLTPPPAGPGWPLISLGICFFHLLKEEFELCLNTANSKVMLCRYIFSYSRPVRVLYRITEIPKGCEIP